MVATLFQHCFEWLQHYSNIVSDGCNIVPTLLCCVALKIVIANRPVQHHDHPYYLCPFQKKINQRDLYQKW